MSWNINSLISDLSKAETTHQALKFPVAIYSESTIFKEIIVTLIAT